MSSCNIKNIVKDWLTTGQMEGGSPAEVLKAIGKMLPDRLREEKDKLYTFLTDQSKPTLAENTYAEAIKNFEKDNLALGNAVSNISTEGAKERIVLKNRKPTNEFSLNLTGLNTLDIKVDSLDSYYRDRIEELKKSLLGTELSSLTSDIRIGKDNSLTALILAADMTLDDMYQELSAFPSDMSEFYEKFTDLSKMLEDENETNYMRIADIQDYIRTVTGHKGDYAAFMADAIGNRYLKLLGVKFDSNVKGAEIQQIKTRIGGIALKYMHEAGLVKLSNLNGDNLLKDPIGETNTTKFAWVNVTDKAKVQIAKIGKNSTQLLEDLGYESTVKAPVRKPAENNRYVGVKNQEFAKAKPELVKAVHNFEQVKWTHNKEGLALFREMFKDALADPKLVGGKVAEAKKEILKHILPDSTPDYTWDKNDKLIIKNADKMTYDTEVAHLGAIEGGMRLVDDFIEFMKIQESLSEDEQAFYFNWFIARNDRLHINSNVVNPQNDKHLSRWLLRPVDSSYDISKKDIDVVLNKLNDNSKGNVPVDIEVAADGTVSYKDSKQGPIDARATVFVYGIIQGLEGLKIPELGDALGVIDTKTNKAAKAVKVPSIDKTDSPDIVKVFNHIVNFTSTEEGMKKLKDLVKNEGAAHLGHAILAITELEKYHKTPADTTFNSSMVMEVDGLTNGLSFKMLQMPLDANARGDKGQEYWNVASVTGIRQSDDKFKGMIDIRAEGKEKDNYVGVSSVANEVNKAILSEKDATSKYDKNTDVRKAKDIINALGESKETLVSLGLFSDITRNDVKPSVLEFMYGSSVRNIAKAFSERKAIAVMDTVLSTLQLRHKNIASLADLIFNAINSNENIKQKDALWTALTKNTKVDTKNKTKEVVKNILDEFFANAGKEDRKSFAINSGVGKLLTYAIASTEGVAVSEGLKSRLGKWESANSTINSAANTIDTMFVMIRDQVLASRGNNKNLAELSAEEFKEVINLIRQYMPMLKGLDNDELTALVTHKVVGTTTYDTGSTANTHRKNKNGIVTKPADYSTNVMIGKDIFFFNPIFRGTQGPGAGTGAVGTHSLDSRTIVTVLNELFKASKYSPLDVFDASVLGGNDYLFIPMYNWTFTDINDKYSMIEDLANNLKHTADTVESWYKFFLDPENIDKQIPDVNLNKAQVDAIVEGIKSKKKKVDGDETTELAYAINTVNDLYNKVMGGRRAINSISRDIAQMVGPNGTSIVSPEKTVDSTEITENYIKKPSFLNSATEDLQVDSETVDTTSQPTDNENAELSPEVKVFIASDKFNKYLWSLSDEEERWNLIPNLKEADDYYPEILKEYKPIISDIIDKGQISEEARDMLVEDYVAISNDSIPGDSTEAKEENFRKLMEHLGLEKRSIEVVEGKKEEKKPEDDGIGSKPLELSDEEKNAIYNNYVDTFAKTLASISKTETVNSDVQSMLSLLHMHEIPINIDEVKSYLGLTEEYRDFPGYVAGYYQRQDNTVNLTDPTLLMDDNGKLTAEGKRVLEVVKSSGFIDESSSKSLLGIEDLRIGKNRIDLFDDVWKKYMYGTIKLHEHVHAAVIVFMQDANNENDPRVQAINKIYEKTRASVRQRLLNGETVLRVSLNSAEGKLDVDKVMDSIYAFTNVDEFVAEAMSNKSLIRYLNAQKVEGKDLTMYEQLVQAILKILEKTGFTHTSDFTELMSNIIEIAHASSKKPENTSGKGSKQPSNIDADGNKFKTNSQSSSTNVDGETTENSTTTYSGLDKVILDTYKDIIDQLDSSTKNDILNVLNKDLGANNKFMDILDVIKGCL